jgi:hypothetical protein
MELWSNVITFAEGANKLKESSQPKRLIYLGNIGGSPFFYTLLKPVVARGAASWPLARWSYG